MNYRTQKPKEGYGYIYKYTSPSGKMYIGKTTRSLAERAGSNGHDYKQSTCFYNAILKYGFENFSVEILGEYPKEELDEKEIYYIHYYNTLRPNGYNMIDQPTPWKISCEKQCQKIIKYDLNGNKIKEYKSIKEAAEDNNILRQSISDCARKIIPQYKDHIYRYAEDEPPKPMKKKRNNGRKTAQYSLDGELIAVYPSANQAALAIGKNVNAGRNIRSVCTGDRETAYGFKWKFLD